MISELAKNIKLSTTLSITTKAAELKASGIDVIGFGAGEPDFDTPDYIKEAAKKAIDDGFTRYTPAAGIRSLREAISKKLEEENGLIYTPEQIVVNNGVKHTLLNAFMSILDPGDEMIIPAPYWLSFAEMVKMVGATPKIVTMKRENNFKLQISEFEQAITPKTKAILINNPSNPTGVIYTKEELQAIADVALKNNLWIVADEIYEYLVYDGKKHVSIASLSEEVYNHTITLNGFSKSFAMTGWRVGYLAAPPEVANAAKNIQSHAVSHPNSIAQKAAEAALSGDKSCLEIMIKEFDRRRLYMYNELSKIKGFDVVKPDGAFYCFVGVSEIYGKSYNNEVIEDANTLAKLLLEEAKVAVVPCADFGTADYIRLSYAVDMPSIEKGVKRISEFINSLT